MRYLPKALLALLVLNSANYSKGEKVETIKQKVIPHENICKFQPNDIILAHPTDCHKFYKCVQQETYEYNCDPEYHYDALTRNCVAGSSCSSVSNITDIACVEHDIRAIQDNCNMFQACISGRYQKINCPRSYYFNSEKAICMPFKYDAQFKCNCLMPEYTVFENKMNCETYYVCHKKSAVIENCPLGQYYNAKLNTCLTDTEGVCLIKPVVRPQHVSELTSDVQVICKKLGLKGIHFRTFPKGCDTFFICVKGQLYTQYCPQDYYYDRDKKYCVKDTIKRCHSTEN